MVPPSHIAAGVALPLILAVGAEGELFTTAEVVPAGLVQPFALMVREYVPVARLVAPGIEGFWLDDVNPFGPVQL